MIERETKEEVTPEELREHFEEAKRAIGNPRLLYQDFFNYVTLHMVKAILRTNADAMKKAEAIYYFGKLAGLVNALADNYWFASYYATAWKEDFYKEMEKKIGQDLQKAVEDVIELYSEVKEGKPLDHAILVLRLDIFELEFDAEEFVIQLGNHIAINYVEKLRHS